jgi:hypothetical protein
LQHRLILGSRLRRDPAEKDLRRSGNLSAQTNLSVWQCISSRVMTARQEIALEATKAFHSRLLMSLNAESEQDPSNLLTLRAYYHYSVNRLSRLINATYEKNIVHIGYISLCIILIHHYL